MELLPCRPYNAMLTRQACRKRQAMEKAKYRPDDVANRALKCLGCDGVSGGVKEVSVESKRIVCTDCGRTMALKARGLCGKCYDQKYRMAPKAKKAEKRFALSGDGGEAVRPAPDLVNHPPHYTTGRIEVIDFIEDQSLGYHDGNVVKYVCRHRHKGTPLQDLKKARWYLDRLIERHEKAAPVPPAPEGQE